MRLNSIVLAVAMALGAPALASAGSPLSLHATNLEGGGYTIPDNLPAERTLVLLAFRHDDQDVLEGWRQGMKLSEATPGWLEIPVIPVTSPMVQPMIRGGMRKHFATDALRAHILILFTAPAPVAAALGVDATQPAVVVLDRAGHVLARAAGGYAPAKAAALIAALAP